MLPYESALRQCTGLPPAEPLNHRRRDRPSCDFFYTDPAGTGARTASALKDLRMDCERFWMNGNALAWRKWA
jgi:hypothetical protein